MVFARPIELHQMQVQVAMGQYMQAGLVGLYMCISLGRQDPKQ